ncbi:hypothetical protein ACEPAI_2830 [Sanghuangporus weigelae]
MSTFSSSRLALAGSSPPLSRTADGLHRRCERPSRARQKIVVVRCDAGTGAGWSFFQAASPDLPGPRHVDILLKMPSRSRWLSSPPPLWTAEWPGRARDRRSLSSDCDARTGAELLP